MYDVATRRLYLCSAWREDWSEFLRAVLDGGVDIVQLRDKVASDDRLREAGTVALDLCREFGVPFIVNDRPDLAREIGADGVHVGQDDVTVKNCRDLLGPSAIVGLSTHEPAQLEAGLLSDATYLSAGPVSATPTKPGREPTGPEYAGWATQRSDRPVFVTGGVTPHTIEPLWALGVRHFVVVRYLTESDDPGCAARELQRAVERAATN